MVLTKHVSSSLRLLDAERHGIRTISGVRRDIGRQNVMALLNGFNAIMMVPAINAQHVVRAEILKDDM